MDDSTAVRSSLRFDTSPDDDFLCFSVSSFFCSSCCLPCHLMVDTCALMDIRTSQAIDRSRPSSHPAVHIHVSQILTCCILEKPSKVVPSFPLKDSCDDRTRAAAAGWWIRRAQEKLTVCTAQLHPARRAVEGCPEQELPGTIPCSFTQFSNLLYP